MAKKVYGLTESTMSRVKEVIQTNPSAPVNGVDTSSGRQVAWVTVTGDLISAGDAAGYYHCRVDIGSTDGQFVPFGNGLCKAHNGVTLQNGKRYIAIRQAPMDGNAVFLVIGDANYTATSSGVETKWCGGLLNTTTQSIKGEKTFRDTIYVQTNIGEEPFVSVESDLITVDSDSSTGEKATVSKDFFTINYESGSTNLYSSMSKYQVGVANVVGSNRTFSQMTDRETYYYSTNHYFSGALRVLRVGLMDGQYHGLVWYAPPYDGASFNLVESTDSLFASGPSRFLLAGSNGRPKYAVTEGATIHEGSYVSFYVEEVDSGGTPIGPLQLVFKGGLLVSPTGASPPVPPVPPVPPPPSGQGTVRLSAWFDDDEDGTWDTGEEPVQFRDVILSGSESHYGQTGSDGYLLIDDITPGTYYLTISLTGIGESCSTNGGSVTVTADTNTDVTRPIIVTLPDPPTVSGLIIVIYKDGVLSARNVSYDGESSGSSLAVASNHFFNNLPVGDYTVTVTLLESDDVTVAWDIDDGTDTGSGVTTDTFATVDGQKTVIRFDLTSTPYEITGTVTRGGSPEVGYTINLTGDATDSTVTNGSGFYSFTVIAGTYNVAPSLTGGDSSAPPDYTGIVVTTSNVTGRDFALSALPPPP